MIRIGRRKRHTAVCVKLATRAISNPGSHDLGPFDRVPMAIARSKIVLSRSLWTSDGVDLTQTIVIHTLSS